MEFESWPTPFEDGSLWLVDLSWGTKEWTLEKSNGVKYLIKGDAKHESHELVARVFHEESETIYELLFESVNGFRCLDEHGLTEVWSNIRPTLNTFKIKGHGWHKESPLTFFMGNDGEWSHLIVTADECLEVICSASPIVKEIGKAEAVAT
ncbi:MULTISPECIES: hypothetical protein [unclassified Pseudoalteromonas]|uniref:hypothetical protein n=1 Tax=unclassified Pseudoalteromonas TaxID=194690 RepID=UPI0020986248|nr:hypothetical protein [Pseudoalteromonas sp. XMcav2-N]MCO7188571.1 hypothetical protein [Pseudoalteromonas sp. XMcav2-N]